MTCATEAFHEVMVTDSMRHDDEAVRPTIDELRAIWGTWSDTFALGTYSLDDTTAGALDHPIRRIVVVNRAM